MDDLAACLRKRFETSKTCQFVTGFPLCSSPQESPVSSVGLLDTISSVATRLNCASRPESGTKTCPRPLRTRPVLDLQELRLCQGIGFKIKEIGERLSSIGDTNVHWIFVQDLESKTEAKAAAFFEKLPLLPPSLSQDVVLSSASKISQAQDFIQNPNHDAYIYALILSLCSRLVQLRFMPHVPLLFGTSRIDSAESPPKLLLIKEAVTCTLDTLIQNSRTGTVDAQHILAWLFSACFALAYLQNLFGYIDDDFTAKSIGMVRLDETRSPKFFWYQWNNVTYRVPTYGFAVKILPSMCANIVLNHHRVAGQTRIDNNKDNVYSFNTDLLSLGTSLQTLLRGKLRCGVPLYTSILRQLIDKWCTCQKVRVDKLRKNCTDKEAQACDRLLFSDMPQQLKCIDAIPALQSRMFVPAFVWKESVPPNVHVYTLNEI